MFEALYSAIPDLSLILSTISYVAWAAIALLLVNIILKIKHLEVAPKLLVLFISLQIILSFANYQIDQETKAQIPEKLVIIEIDDFWNLEGEHFDKYGYSIENYESVISLIEQHNFTATLGVSPYIFIEETQDINALKHDERMIEYLKKKKDAGHEIAMHGYAHCRNTLYCPDYEENYLNILQGKKELDTLFNQSTVTYLPPGNKWDDPQYDNVKKTGFLIIPNTAVSKPYWDSDVLITQRGYDVISRWDWYGGNTEHFPYADWIRSYDETDLFVIQLHSNTFNSKEKLDELDKFLDFLEKEDVKVVTYQQAYATLKHN
jgi:peptidoglycan/xylan/chitin deacetylase (PgdA/CDA1 family)